MSKGRILIVEDDRDIGEMLKHYFDYKGYEVLYAVRGNDALELSRQKLTQPRRPRYHVARHGRL